MRITRIALENFQCFFGRQEILIEEGCNVFYGRNGSGKSRFFNAFNWCLNRTYFEATRSKWYLHEKSDYDSYERISCHAAKHIGSAFTTSVELDFEVHPEWGVSQLRLVRFFKWDGEFSDLEVRLHFIEGGENCVVDDQELVDEKLRIWFDPELRKYMWFQGENIGSLIKISEGGSVQSLTRKISHWRLLADMHRGAELFKKCSQREYENALAANDTHNNLLHQVQAELGADREKLEALEKEVEELDVEHRKWKKAEDDEQEVIDQLAENADKSKAFKDAQKKTAVMDGIRKRVREKYEVREKSGGMLGIVGHGANEFSSDVDLLRDWLEARKAELGTQERSVISVDVPSADELKRLIDARKCEVCGTDAPEGSDAFVHMEARLNEMLELAVGQSELRSLNILQREIEQVVSFVLREEISANERWDSFVKERTRADQEWEEARANTEDAEDKLGGVVADISRYQTAQTLRDQAKSRKYAVLKKYGDKKVEVGVLASKVKRNEGRLGNMANETALPELLLWKQKVGILLEPIFNKIVEEERLRFIADLERVTNAVYKDYLKGAEGVVGVITIDSDTWAIHLDETNTTNIKMAEIALMTAVLLLAKEKIKQEYPLIVDAPTSVMDEVNSMSYIRVTAESFGQSIIISKDYDKEKLGNGLDIESAYRFVPLTTSGEKFDKEKGHVQNDLAVKIERL